MTKKINETQDCLSVEQRNQILKQVQYHISANQFEYLDLNNYIKLKFSIFPNVTRPMSSKGISKWLWNNSELFYNKKVCDIGTGCGIQGITCKLSGAEYVTFSDIIQDAVDCTKKNIKNILPNDIGTKVLLSDLFDSFELSEKFDLIIFAQPYFPGEPIEDYEFTKGMLNTQSIQNRFFENAKKFLNKNGKILMMGWEFVGMENNPSEISQSFGYKIVRTENYFDWQGVQQGVFNIILLELE
jgi:predicted RNA methylase